MMSSLDFKMVGSHSSGEASSHKLIGIGDAYDAALVASQKEDPMLTVIVPSFP